MKVQVLDAIMGYGKSTYAISTINSELDNYYFVVLPLLDEVERYKSNCINVELVEPSEEETSKSNDLLDIIRNRQNVVTTHHLFERLTDEHLSTLRKLPMVKGEKVLILDETIDLVRSASDASLTNKNLRADRDNGYILVHEGTGKVAWNPLKNCGYNHHEHLKNLCDTGMLFFLDEEFVVVEVSTEFLSCFDRIIVMTYRWDSSIMAVQLGQVHGVEVENLPLMEDRLLECYRYIADHLVIPDDYCSEDFKLSWYQMRGRTQEAASLVNKFTKEAMKDYDIPLELTRYTTFKEAHGFDFIDYFKSVKIGQWWKRDSKGKTIPASFLSHTALGTNEHAHCKLMVYGLDKNLNPGIGRFFSKHDASISYDEWSLSSMLQWLFRGCVRNRDANEKMIAVIPSPRMRKMAQDWLAAIAYQAEHGINPYDGAFARLDRVKRGNVKRAHKGFLKNYPHASHITLDEFAHKGMAKLKREYKQAA
ncbi:hypothetical protein [Halomonas litopenaei]|uniref:hypothetical protein n=1 Tax=Halomonas litopenaei TaxID=2109328 RepID=UPI001A8FA5CD|nr:hypothetical protein [Halomonas litopenaei]MBN8414355.1 hypothetical protein [Halomonas litopenaei]